MERLRGLVLGGLEGFKLLLEQSDPGDLPGGLPPGREAGRDQPGQQSQHRQRQKHNDSNQTLQHQKIPTETPMPGL